MNNQMYNYELYLQQMKNNPYLAQNIMYHPNANGYIINNGVSIHQMPYTAPPTPPQPSPKKQ
jgi:hypothetical protein